MKKILSLLSLLMLCVVGANAEKVIYSWPSDASAANKVTLAEGVTIQITGNESKTVSSAKSITINGTKYTSMKVSNGAQNTLTLPKKATSITFYSYINKASDAEGLRDSYWKEVAGQTYTESDGQIFDLTKTASAPNKAEFVLNNVQNELTFTNTGEQQSVVILLEYHTGGADGVENVTADVESKSDAIYNLAGQKVKVSYKGIVIQNGVKRIVK